MKHLNKYEARLKLAALVIPVAVLIGLASECQAQARPEFKYDTARYAGQAFYVGATVDLWYGSANDKTFAFVFMGSGMQGWEPLQATFSKHRVMVDKVYKMQGKVFARGILVDAPDIRALGGNKVLLDIEGAIDNKELALPTNPH
jgi:hypothetical protein